MSKRIFGLDILRAGAIILVLIYHSNQLLNRHIGKVVFYAIPDGVTLFFVLSGFLIGAILLRMAEQDKFNIENLKIFWYRRWLRTIPAYTVVLILLILHRYWVNIILDPLYYLKYFIFTQNINSGKLNFFGESWSLSVEEWFYILLPALIFLSIKITKAGPRKILIFWIIFFICIFHVFRVAKTFYFDVNNYAEWNNVIRKTVLTRLDSIIFGFAGALAFHYNFGIWNRKRVLFAAGIIILAYPSISYLFFGHNWVTFYLKITCESLGTLLLLPLLNNMKSAKGVLANLWTRISVLSYSIYLVNFSMFYEWILTRMNAYAILKNDYSLSSDLIRFACFLLWTFAAAWLLHVYVERPFIKIRDRLYPNQ